MMAKVAVLGLGAMGSRMASNLLASGHQVTVWNRSAGAVSLPGATVAASPRAAATGASVVISMLRDDNASQAVWLDEQTGALAGMGPEAVGIEASTLSLASVQRLTSAFAAADRSFLDAPVAGSRPQAEAAQLIFLVGGPAEVLAQVAPILRCMGQAVHHAGPVGQGTMLKLAVNMLLGVQVAAIAEIMGQLARQGADLTKAMDIIGAVPVCSPAAKAAAAGMLSGGFAPMFPVELVEKDFGYALADSKPSTMPLATVARDVFARAIAKGFGADNLTGVIRLYR